MIVPQSRDSSEFEVRCRSAPIQSVRYDQSATIVLFWRFDPHTTPRLTGTVGYLSKVGLIRTRRKFLPGPASEIPSTELSRLPASAVWYPACRSISILEKQVIEPLLSYLAEPISSSSGVVSRADPPPALS